MKRVLVFFALSGAILLAGCGGNGDTTSQSTFNNGSGNQPYKPKTHLSHRALVSNYFANDLQVMDATENRLTSTTFATGTQPTYMQLSPDASLTFTNNIGSQNITTFENLQENVKASNNLGGSTESFVTTVDNQNGYAAVPSYSNGFYRVPGAIVRFNPFSGSLNTQIMFPNVQFLGLDPAEKHLVAFTNSDYLAYWVDLTTVDPSTEVPPFYPLTLSDSNNNPVLLSRPVAVFFSADDTKAYVLSCGPECGGTAPASVTVIDTTTITPPAGNTTGTAITAKVINVWPVKGAQSGRIDTTANKLYVVGSTGTTTVDSGGNTVLDGWFTNIDLSSSTSTPLFVSIGPGTSRIIRSVNGIYWIGAQSCGVQSCVTMVNPAATSPGIVLPNANGNATGIAYIPNSGQVYTVEGSQFLMYDQSANPVTSIYNTDIKGQAWDVLYID